MKLEEKYTQAQILSACRCWNKGDSIEDIAERLSLTVYQVKDILVQKGIIKVITSK